MPTAERTASLQVARGQGPASGGFRPTPATWGSLAAVAALYMSGLIFGAGDGLRLAGSGLWAVVAGLAGAVWLEAAELLVELAPYWLAGVLIGAALSTVVSGGGLAARLRSGGPGPYFVAAGAGALVPLCSCSVVPVLAGLTGAGVPLGPAMAFLVSAPMLNAQTVVLTAGALGWPLAAARVAATFAIAWSAGVLLSRWQRRLADPGAFLTVGAERSGGNACGRLPSAEAGLASLPRLPALILRSAAKRLVELNGVLLLAVLIAGGIEALLPADWIGRALGGTGPWSVPLAALVAVPVYVCTYVEVPTAAALVSKGMGPGATLAYLLGGPGLSAASIAMLTAVFRARVIAAYAGLSFAGCVLAGWLFNLLA